MARRNQPKKIRLELRKNHESRARRNDLTRDFGGDKIDEDSLQSSERLSGKGDLTRKRTIVGDQSGDAADADVVISVDAAVCLPGRVLRAQGLNCWVEPEGQPGRTYQCATRRLLKSLNSDDRHVIVTGDRVQFRPVNDLEGMVERIEPRQGELSRTSKGRRHVIAANVDQLLIVVSAAEPPLKANLIDRLLISAETGDIKPVVCINKVDLVEPAHLQPLVGVYSQMGYTVHLLSVRTGQGIDRLRKSLVGRASAVAGQSGVGKSSLLNAVEPGLALRIGRITADTQKGRHTTTSAELLPLASGGYMVDTPGVRQFELWDVEPAEVGGFFRDLRPFINLCRFPNCTHTHEDDCGVKDAVADNFLDARRYESYLHLLEGDAE